MTRLSSSIDRIKDHYTVVVVVSGYGHGNPPFERLNQLVKPNEEPWKSLSQLALQAVKDHRQNLLFNIARKDTESTLAP
jgi:hypothetical protein